MKIGMYDSDEIYDELANGFLHHSMVDAMYFEIIKLREENQQLKKQKEDVVEYIKTGEILDTWGNYRPFKEFGYGKDILRMLGEIDVED